MTLDFHATRPIAPETRLLIASLCGLVLLMAALHLWGDNLPLELIAIAVFGVMHIALLQRSFGMFLFYFPVLFSDIGMLLANAVMASGHVFIVEANYTSYDIGAFPLLLMSLTTLFVSYAALVWRFDKPIAVRSITSKWEPRVVTAIAAIPLLVSYVAFLRYGTPWSTGQTRSAFWALGHVPQFFFTFGFNRQDFSLILAGLLAFIIPDRKFKRAGYVLVVLIAVSNILFGARGGPVITTAVMFLLPYGFMRKPLSGQETVRIMGWGAVLIFAMLFVTLLSYAVAYRYGLAFGLQSTLARIILQGQVWWNIYYTKTVSHIGETGASFWNELSQFFSLFPSRTACGCGSDLILKLIAPPDIYKGFIAEHVRFAADWPALGYFYFGAWGLQLVQILLGVFYGITALALKREMLRAHYFSVILVYMLWWTYMFEVIATGEIWQFLNIRPLIVLTVLIMIKCSSRLLMRLVEVDPVVRTT